MGSFVAYGLVAVMSATAVAVPMAIAATAVIAAVFAAVARTFGALRALDVAFRLLFELTVADFDLALL